MEINHADYQVTYDPSTATIACQGAFRLQGGAEYNPILELPIEAADAKPSLLTLDLRTLQLLNSSGINMLSKFVLQVRKHKYQPGSHQGQQSVFLATEIFAELSTPLSKITTGDRIVSSLPTWDKSPMASGRTCCENRVPPIEGLAKQRSWLHLTRIAACTCGRIKHERRPSLRERIGAPY
jgi:hypothetical protein